MKASEIMYSNLQSLFEGKVYPLVRPDSEKGSPYLVYTVLNTNPETFIDGYSGDELAYLQIDIYSDSYDVCEAMTVRVIDLLDKKAQPFYYEGRRYLYEDDTKLFRQSLECHLWQTNWKTILNYQGNNFDKVGNSNKFVGSVNIKTPE